MKTELKTEIERLKHILKNVADDIEFPPGASEEKIHLLESATGLKIDEDLKEFYRFADGSDYQTIFAVFSDQVTPCSFEPIDEVIDWWQRLHQIPEPFDPIEEERDFNWKLDERLQPFWRHPRWLPFAQFNGFSTSVMLDNFPSEKGSHGQIIVYQHDPDAMYFVAENFLQFLKTSNDLLEKSGDEFFS